MNTTLVGGPLDGQQVEVPDILPITISVAIQNSNAHISVNPFLIPAAGASFTTVHYRLARYKPGKKETEIRYVYSEIYPTMVEGKKRTK